MSRLSLCIAPLLISPLLLAGCRSAPPGSVEVPMLAPRVEAGELPPVAERLPAEPARIEPLDGPGEYGGSLRMLEAVEQLWSVNLLGQAGLFRYDPLGLTLTPDLALGYRFSDDYKTLELQLRPGHRWSDGEPFTADDIVFWWQAYANHPAFEPEPFWQFESGQMQVEKIDDYTLHFVFPVAYPVVLDRWGRALLSTDGLRGPILPRHYLEQFHLDYNPEAEALAEAEGLDTWQALFTQQADSSRGLNPERPSLWMWIPEAGDAETPSLVRNPYFHQIDDRGRQLPYIDRIEVQRVGSREALVPKVLSGEIDFEGFYIGPIDLPALTDLAEGQSLRLATSLETSLFTIHFNLNTADPDLRARFGQRDFRLALSRAIDREAIAREVFDGHAKASPALPLPQHAFYDPAWTEPLIRFDPEEASALLDGLGLEARGADGYRLGPSGEVLALQLQMYNDGQQNRAICDRVIDDWQAVGLLAQCRGTSVAQLTQWQIENKLQLPVWNTSRTSRILRTDPRWFGFESPDQQWWAPLWSLWLSTDGSEGEQPPEEIMALAEQFDRWQALPYEAPEASALARDYFAWFAENMPMIGTVGLQDHPIVIDDRLRGFPEKNIYWSADSNFYTPYLPAQWWLKE